MKAKGTVAHELPLGLSPCEFFSRMGLTMQESQIMVAAVVVGAPYQEIANDFTLSH